MHTIDYASDDWIGKWVKMKPIVDADDQTVHMS